MKTIRVFQLIWAGLLLYIISFDALGLGLVASGPLLALALVYVSACILALASSRVAWLVVLVVPAIMMTRGIMAIFAAAFATDDSLNRDSRVTISIVVAVVLLLILPPAFLLSRFWQERMSLRLLFRRPWKAAA